MVFIITCFQQYIRKNKCVAYLNAVFLIMNVEFLFITKLFLFKRKQLKNWIFELFYKMHKIVFVNILVSSI